MKVLVVDDSSPVRERLVELLRALDGVTEVVEAWDTAMALEKLASEEPRLVLLDLRLPGGGGMRVLEKLVGMSERPTVAVLTNYPYPQLRAKCVEMGGDFFLDKSSDFERIGDIVESLVEESKRE